MTTNQQKQVCHNDGLGLHCSLFCFLLGKWELHHGNGTEVTKKLVVGGLPIGFRFLPLRINGKDYYAG